MNVQLLIPVGIFIYLLIKGHSHPILTTAFPLFLSFGRAGFIDIMPSTEFGPLSIQDMFFLLIVIGWLKSRRQRPANTEFWKNKAARWAFIPIIFFAIELVYSLLLQGYLGYSSLLQIRPWLYFPLSYLFFVDTYRRYDRAELLFLFRTLAEISAFLLVFYIANSFFDLGLYPYKMYLESTYGGTFILRDLSTFPLQLIGLAIAYLSCVRPKNLGGIVILAIIVVGTLFTYQRSLIVLVIAAPFIVLLLVLMRHRRLKIPQKTVLKAVGIAAIGIIILIQLIPVQLEYIGLRFYEVMSKGLLSSRNVQYRISFFLYNLARAARSSIVLGSGFWGKGGLDSYDSDWIFLVFRFGLAGIMVFLAPIILAIVVSIKCFWRAASKDAELFSLILVLYLFFYFVLRFTSIVYLWWFPVSVWGFALIAIERFDLWLENLRVVPPILNANHT
jgi:hypothetical protein